MIRPAPQEVVTEQFFRSFRARGVSSAVFDIGP